MSPEMMFYALMVVQQQQRAQDRAAELRQARRAREAGRRTRRDTRRRDLGVRRPVLARLRWTGARA